jgi:hypothetical protein
MVLIIRNFLLIWEGNLTLQINKYFYNFKNVELNIIAIIIIFLNILLTY